MIPTSTTKSSSRRSSILKPPKPRQPLQNLNFNSSSCESSPATATKFKRRVSFAEKKHVKEFCNSVEQGTVWDNTYEEHDLSNIKLTFSSDKEQCNIESVRKENIEDADISNDIANTHFETVDDCVIEETNVCSAHVEIIQNDLAVVDYKAPCEKLLKCTELVCNPSTENELLVNASSIILNDEVEETNESVLLNDAPLNSEKRVSKSFTVYEDPTVDVSNKIVNCQELGANNLNYVEMNTVSILNTDMDFTEIISNNIYPDINCIERDEIEKSSQQDIVNLNLYMTQKFNDVSMEITTAVPSKPYNLQEEYYGNDKGINVSQEVSMEMTEAIGMNCLMKQDRVDNKLLLEKTVPQTKNNVTCMSESTMEMTKPVNTYSLMENNFEISNCINPHKKVVNSDKTVMHNDQKMEFTTGISTIIKMHSVNLNLELDKTKIFPNNSMTITATVSSVNKIDTCEEEPTITEPTIMELTEAVLPLQRIPQREDSIANTSEIKQTVLPENVENRSFSINSFNQSEPSVPGNVLRDITSLVDPPSLTSSKSPDKMDCTINNLKEGNFNDKLTKEALVNITANTALHVEQDTYASALNGNNAEVACAIFNSVSNKSLCTVTSHTNQNKCLQHNDSQNIISHPRRTYTVKPLNNDLSFTNSLEKGGMNPETSNVSHPRRTYTIKPLNSELSFTSNLKKSSMNPEMSNDMEAKDNCSDQFLLKRDSFCNKSLEELESIKPPSFICLDDLSDENMSANINYNKEIDANKEVDSLLKSFKVSRVTECEEPSKFSQVVALKEDVDEFRKCLNECTSLHDQSISSKSELNNQTQISEDQQLNLSIVDDVNMEVQDLNSSSSTMSDNEKNSIYNIVGVRQNLHIQNDSYKENLSVKPPSLNRNDTCEEVLDVHPENNHLSDDKIKLSYDKNILNSMKEVVKESSEIQLSLIEKDIEIELDSFSSLIKELNVCAQSDEIIWEVYHENIERKMFIIGFISCSLLVIIFLSDDHDAIDSQFIKDIKIISRLADDADDLISMVHRIILEKLDIKKVMSLYNTSETVLSMLDYISKEVKLVMDFMFELKRLEDLNLMEITRDRISFISYTKRMDIILRITLIIKPFEKIEPQDIFIHCLFGSVREEEIRKLIKNIKRDHKFLRRYINDVREYIYLMEESASTIKLPF